MDKDDYILVRNIAMLKRALHTERKQIPTTDQVARQKSVVLIKGDPEFIKQNPLSNKFYQDIVDFVRQQGCTITQDNGAASEDTKTIPAAADLWIGHSRGTNRLKYAPKETKTLMFGSWRPGAINHPRDNQQLRGYLPSNFHYILTDEMKQAILKKLKN